MLHSNEVPVDNVREMEPQRVVVTGGLGFIGSALAERLLDAGAKVTIVDSLVSNVVAPAHFTSRFPLARVEVGTVSSYFASHRFAQAYDLIVHAASLVGPAGILAHTGTIGADIVLSTASVIEHCTTNAVPLVYLSSAEVFGRSGELSEATEIRVPARYNARIEYALGKLTCESMIVNSRSRGLRATIIRPFNVVGSRQSRDGGFVMPTFVQQALAGRPLTIFGSGQQRRAFTAVSDVVDFLTVHAIRALDDAHTIFNVGNPANNTSVVELAHRVVALLKSSSELQFTDGAKIYGPLYCEAESYDKLPVVDKAAAAGWNPRKSLDEIILEAADFYRSNGNPLGADARRTAA